MLYDYIRNGLEIADPTSGRGEDPLKSSSTLFSYLCFLLLDESHTITDKHLQ